MGNTYLIYTEANIDGEWRCIDGYYKRKSYGKKDEEWTLFSTFESGSRTYFSDAYEKLGSIGRNTAFSELSEEIKAEHPGLAHEYNIFGNEDVDKEAYYITVSYKDFKRVVPKGHTHHGIIHKDFVSEYEEGDRNELWEDDQLDFAKLSDIEKLCYKYYEWDNPYEWQCQFKRIDDSVKATINKYMNNELICNSLDIRLVVFCL